MPTRGSVLRCLLLVALSVTGAACQAQPPVAARLQDAIGALRILAGDGLEAWRFQHPAAPGGESPDLDDSSWGQVRPQHSWSGNDSAAWYRVRVTVPARIGAAPVPGGPLVLRVAVDDDGEIYVDGALAQKFHWDQGQVTLTEDARPGQSFLVALKVLNQGGPGALMSASLTYEKLAPVKQAAQAQVLALQLAADTLRNCAAPPASALRAATRATEALGTATLTASAEEAGAAITTSARELAPLEPLAKQYAMYLVGHAHIDMNWLWLWPETVQACHDTWWQAVRFMDEFPEFRFSQSQPGAYAAIQDKYPDLFAQIRRYVANGRWELVTASWVEGDTNMASGEALVRQTLASREFCQDNFGQWTETLWLPDNFGHAWTIPMIFSDAGIRYFCFFRGGPGVPLFWWRSADGSRLAGFNYGSYNWSITPDILRTPQDIARQQGVGDALIPYGVGNHGGGPTRRDINLALDLRRTPLAPRMMLTRADEYYRAALSKGTELPVVPREMGFLCRGCYTAHADIKRLNRRLENLLPTAETAALAARLYTGRPYPNDAFMGAWHNVLFNQFHDLLCGTAIHDSYEYSREIAAESQTIGEAQLRESLQALAAQADTRGVGPAGLVWNRLGWERAGVLDLPAPEGAAAGSALQAVGPDGARHAAQVVELPGAEGPRRSLLVEGTVPACGWAVYHLQPGQAAPTAGQGSVSVSQNADSVALDNGLLRVVVSKASGALTSVRDLTEGRELVPAGEEAGQLQILWEGQGNNAWDVGRVQWTRPIARAESVQVAAQGPLAGGVRVRQSWGKSSFATQIGLRAGARQVDFRMVAHWQEIGTAQDGGPMLKVAFPTALRTPSFTCSIPFGSVARAADGQDVPSQMWADLTTVRRNWTRGFTPVTVDLERYFDQDCFATDDDPSDGDFDGMQVSFPAATFAPARDGLMDFEGVPWRVPPTAPGRNNAIRCQGRRIELPRVVAGGVTVFGSAAPSAGSGSARLVFSDGTVQDANLSFADWCFPAGPGERLAARGPYRLGATGQMGPQCHIFAYTLNVPAGKTAVALVLPRAPQMRVMAITLGPGVQDRPLYGAAVLNDCKYGVDASGSTLRLTLLRASCDPDPVPDVGIHEISYALVPHRGDWSRDGQVERRAWDLNNPLGVLPVEAHAGRLPGTGSLVSLEPANLILAAVKQAEDGRGLIVRWYESAGRATMARLRFGFDVASAHLTNSVEAVDRGALAARGREVSVPSRAYGMVTVRVQPAGH